MGTLIPALLQYSPFLEESIISHSLNDLNLADIHADLDNLISSVKSSVPSEAGDEASYLVIVSLL
jgi:hypothetical protein